VFEVTVAMVVWCRSGQRVNMVVLLEEKEVVEKMGNLDWVTIVLQWRILVIFSGFFFSKFAFAFYHLLKI
jgi:hypothetical protein